MLRRCWQRLIGAYFRHLDRLIKKRARLPPGATWRSDVFPWLTPLGESAPRMREELERYIAAGGVLPDKEELSPGRTAQYGLERWEFLHLIVYGERLEAITRHFPQTLAALQAVPGCCNAMFSRLPQQTRRILKHHDGENGTLRVHVPLKVPARGSCFMRIGGEDVHWQEGEAFALDATIDHEVFKDAGEERIILILDFLPPAPLWLKALCQKLYPRLVGQVAQQVLRASYSRLLTLR